MKYKVVHDEPGQQSIAGKINDLMKLIDVPALRGNITPRQAVNAWTASMSEESTKGHFGETIPETAKKQMAFWLKMESVGASKEAALAAWLENFNKFILMSFLTAFWETDLQTAKSYASKMDLLWLESPEGRLSASKFIFETLKKIQNKKA